MGVPAFFRWLSRKYPSVIIECVENRPIDEDGRNVLEDSSLPNPNGIEFDNLYLDMNGIIHPCTHPEDKPAPKNEDEMMLAIFDCIDRIFGIVRPRKVLYMAIDGVAPRAKMNQQRSRRFRSAKESLEKQLEIQRIRAELLARGCVLPPEKPKEDHFDSNCITPGTPFMEKLSICLQYYIHDRLNNNPGWKGIKVILSDANVPGEGEHKIMDYIRKQRAQPDHDPNTQHVLCGADADLIMLGLATHEPNFTIIREEFLPNKPRPCDICGKLGHEMDMCEGLNAINLDADAISNNTIGSEVKFIFVRLCVLREYLKRTLAMPNLPFPYDFERVLDDWVFMCFFVGNDFLPHLPSLEIRENAVDRLVELYKQCAYKTKGYLTDSGDVNLDSVQMIMTNLGYVEDRIFQERQRREEQFKNREKSKRKQEHKPNFSDIKNSQFAPIPLGRGLNPAPTHHARQEAARFRIMGMTSVENNNSGSRALESLLRPEQQGQQDHNHEKRGKKRKSNEISSENVVSIKEEEDYQENDEVRLWEDGFKDRYYESKFDVSSTNQQFRYSVALQYVRGLCWVLKYYYQGCASWKWYFPYHYAPFASDFVNISGLSTEFEKGTKPFNPLEQLMGVFPAASGNHVPKPWATLMSDPKSPIIDFYPEDFKIDLNGKKFAWQGVALLPFVDERRLFKALEPYYKLLTKDEIRRNIRGDSRLYLGPENSGYKFINKQYKNKLDVNTDIPISIDGMGGVMLLSEDATFVHSTLSSPIPGLPDITGNQVIIVRFRDNHYDEGHKFPAIRLPNAVDPECVLAPENKGNNYKPVIGFNRNLPTASLGAAGHRMVNNANSQGRNFAAIPPQYNNQRNNYQSDRDQTASTYLQHQLQNQYGNRHSNYNQGGGNSSNHNQWNRNSSIYNQGGRNNYQGNNSNYANASGSLTGLQVGQWAVPGLFNTGQSAQNRNNNAYQNRQNNGNNNWNGWQQNSNNANRRGSQNRQRYNPY